MALNLQLPSRFDELKPSITVIGVGGAGGNAVNNMINARLEGAKFVIANTDAQAIDTALAETTIQLGAHITKGLGAGANPDVGRAAAEEAADEIAAHIDGSNMLFITAGMGGGTGTGAAPVVARIAREQGILTVAVVTKPFQFEGAHRMRLAESGLKELQDYVDTLIVIPNQNLFRIANERTTFADAFKMADEVLHSGVRGITDLMVKPGLINLDFADIRAVMREMGKAMMGTGEATGERRAVEAAEAAISNPLLDDVSLKGAKALLINITGGYDMTLFEVDEAANRVRQEVDPDANIIFGSAFSDTMEGRMRVSVVATGIDSEKKTQAPEASATKRPGYMYSAAPRPAEMKQASSVVQPQPAPIVHQPIQAGDRELIRPVAGRDAAVAAKDALTEPAPFTPRKELLAQAEQELNQEEQLPQSAPMERAVASPSPASVTPRGEHYLPPVQDEQAMRGLFQRLADVGRSLSQSRDTLQQPAPAPVPQAASRNVQVSEKPRTATVQRNANPESNAPKQATQPQDEEYLDIPAFLRRKAQ